MAEQDRCASHWNSNPDNPVKDSSRSTKFGSIFRGSGAEQDCHNSHFSTRADKIISAASRIDTTNFGSGAEQDRHESHFGLKENSSLRDAATRFNEISGSGAEQDRHESHFGFGDNNPIKDSVDRFNSSRFGRRTSASGSEQDLYSSHFSNPNNPIDPSTVGIFRSTLLPSIGFHSGLAIVAYAACRATDRVDGKDWLWPSAQVLNAWWSAVGYRVMNENISVGTAYSHLPYTEKLLLTGVSAWGARLLYKTVTQTLKRDNDDPKFEVAKKEEGFWNKALFSIFLPEALFQAVISLPLTLPFTALDASAYASPLHVHPEYTHGIAVALFSAGLAMEVLADTQLTAQKEASPDDLNREGVWSIVRHPNYLGDTLVHASFPLLLWSSGIMHPLALLGPVANYVYLRYVSGAEDETSEEQKYVKESQRKHGQLIEYKQTKNSFWPRPEEISNPWTWIIVGAGVVGLALEKGFRKYLLS